LAILAGSLAAIVVNVLYYFFLKEFVGIEFIAPDEPGVVPREAAPLPATDVVIFSMVYCVGAATVFLIIVNTVRRPAPIFVTISLVVLFLSLFLPFFMPTPPIPVSTEASLASMHIVGAAVLVPILVGIGLPIESSAEVETTTDVDESA
jgi:hypothetical protein